MSDVLFIWIKIFYSNILLLCYKYWQWCDTLVWLISVCVCHCRCLHNWSACPSQARFHRPKPPPSNQRWARNQTSMDQWCWLVTMTTYDLVMVINRRTEAPTGSSIHLTFVRTRDERCSFMPGLLGAAETTCSHKIWTFSFYRLLYIPSLKTEKRLFLLQTEQINIKTIQTLCLIPTSWFTCKKNIIKTIRSSVRSQSNCWKQTSNDVDKKN